MEEAVREGRKEGGKRPRTSGPGLMLHVDNHRTCDAGAGGGLQV